MMWFWVGILLLSSFCLADDRGARPQLINDRVVPLSSKVLGESYEYLLTSLEFDQDVYINDPLMCPGEDRECSAPAACEPCDFSGESPTGCENPNCCGAAQYPQYPASNHTNDWCDSSLPPYTKLEYNKPSEEFSLAKGEYKYFRFFVGDEQYCRTIRVEVTSRIGDIAVVVSNLLAYPDGENLEKIENGQQFYAGKIDRREVNDFGKSVLHICPNVNPLYERGTYAIALVGFYENNVGSISVTHGDEYPVIAPPEERIRCEDLDPETLFVEPVQVSRFYGWGGNVCLEEGVTSDIVLPRGSWWDFVLPVRAGCQEISFSFNGFTNTFSDPNGSPDMRTFVGCGTSKSENTPGTFTSTIVAQLGTQGTWYISSCFDEPTMLHCGVGSFYAVGKVSFQWSTEAKLIRQKITDIDPSMLTTYYGVDKSGVLQKDENFIGLSSWSVFGDSFLTQPTANPLLHYPPYPEEAYKFTQDPLELYMEAGLSEPKSNMVSFFDYTVRRGSNLRSIDRLMEEGIVYLTGITSATGMPVELCNDNDFDSGKCERGRIVDEYDWLEFLPTRTVSSLSIAEPECDGDLFNKHQRLVDTQVRNGLQSSEFSVLNQKAFLLDIFNAAQPYSSCVTTMERLLDTEVANISQIDSRYCPYAQYTDEYNTDPCCSSRALAFECCAPTTLFSEQDLFTGLEESELTCKHPDCAETYFSDIATSLNGRGNRLGGCETGLEDAEFELRVLKQKAIRDLVTPCLESSGYGERMQGVDCVTNEDCSSLGSSCDIARGVCRLPATQEVRDNYFDCFFENMPPMVEDFIRRKILSPVDADYPKDTKYFKNAVRTAATQFDCLGLDPLDFSYGERYASDAALYCKGVDLTNIDKAEEFEELCPEFLCLGEWSCHFEIAKLCRTPRGREECIDRYHELISPTESSCPTEETVCSTNTVLSLDSDCEEEEYQCISCLNDLDSCVVVEGVDTEEECEQLVACEVRGEIRYDLTEEECLSMTSCTSLCDGESCRSVDEKKGACVVEGATECGEIGGMEYEGECILEGIKSSYACDQAGLELSLATQWYMCESMSITECQDHVNFTSPYKYLRCFVDIFEDCENEDACLASGTCSDVEVARNIKPDSSGWFSATYGTCVTSGVIIVASEREPYCGPDDKPYKYGCHRPEYSLEDCEAINVTESAFPYVTSWITPARTEETCRQEVLGRLGCYLPKEYEKTFWFWQREDCECKQGTADYYYSWSPGIWEQGTPHSLTWTQKKEKRAKYTWEESLSLVTMESWVLDAVEDSFVYVLKSKLVCEGNYVSSSLSAIVCDCVDQSDSCFSSDIETEVGISGACADETSLLKGPTSFTQFSETSVNSLCLEASLFLIQRSWFLFPRSAPSVSFQFAEEKDVGVVQNSKGAEVGVIMGDGSNIIFNKPERVEHFYTCLLIFENEADYSDKYPRRDFGVPFGAEYSSIRPLGLKKIEERYEESIKYWCANLTKEELSGVGVTVFPLLTLENAEDEENDSISHRTKSLLYTLAACYALDLLLLFIYVVVTSHRAITSNRPLAPITLLGVIFGIVCVFRIAFCFVYVGDGFSKLGEYIVFEIPTFLLFTGVLHVLTLFLRLGQQNSFDFKSGAKYTQGIAIAALIFIWSIFIIVAVVYSEVILEDDDVDDLACPGRVPATESSVEENTRTLSIVYQSIVIFLTLVFALVFLKATLKLFHLSKSEQRAMFVFRLGAATIISFFLRCILFLILLAADITSDIYLFIVLFLTEVLLFFYVAIELNKNFYIMTYSKFSNTMGRSKSGTSVAGTGKSNPGSTYEM